ncbi:MAG: hypothetical protein ACYDEE_00095 [Ignavibacteriaceae bacterium]
MNSFYSLIKISTNPTSGDQITVGLLLKTENRFFLKFSDRRIAVSLRLRDEEDRFFSFFKNQLENRISEFNSNSSKIKSELFPPQSFLTSDFFSHLKKSSNNLIQFSEPSIVSGDFSEEQFNKLYEIFVEKIPVTLSQESNKDEKLYINVEQKLIHKVEKKVHTNYDITPKIVPSLNFSYKLDCLGKNGSIISAKSLDFNFTPQTIERYLVRYEVVLSKLSEIYGNGGNKAFIIADEPTIKNSENFNIWEAIKKSPFFEVKSSDNANEIADYIEQKNARMFLPVEE